MPKPGTATAARYYDKSTIRIGDIVLYQRVLMIVVKYKHKKVYLGNYRDILLLKEVTYKLLKQNVVLTEDSALLIPLVPCSVKSYTQLQTAVDIELLSNQIDRVNTLILQHPTIRQEYLKTATILREDSPEAIKKLLLAIQTTLEDKAIAYYYINS